MSFNVKVHVITTVGLVRPLHEAIDLNALTDENNVALTDENDQALTDQ